jgi:hypothetical protein
MPTIAAGGTPNQYCDTSKGKVQMDDYGLARKNNITLRLDELSSGVNTLLQTAYNYQNSVNPTAPPTYRAAAYSMDTLWSIPSTNNLLMTLSTNYQSAWTTAAQSFGVMEYFSNGNQCGNAACSSGIGGDDVATNYDNAMSSINTTMPNPGNGSNQAGDKPQEVLFFVTDGVEDEYNGGRLIQAINANGATNYCSLIKARGIKIAILYTDYLPLPANGFYEGNVAPFQATIGPALQACASPGLYYEASVDTNLGQALVALFNAFVQQNAALSN